MSGWRLLYAEHTSQDFKKITEISSSDLLRNQQHSNHQKVSQESQQKFNLTISIEARKTNI